RHAFDAATFAHGGIVAALARLCRRTPLDERSTMKIETARIDTPIGAVYVAANSGRLCALGFLEQWPVLEQGLHRRFGDVALHTSDDPAGVLSRLRAYFAGNLAATDTI